jgi:hypothetical protein
LNLFNNFFVTSFEELSHTFDVLDELLVDIFDIKELIFTDILVELGCPLLVLEVYD